MIGAAIGVGVARNAHRIAARIHALVPQTLSRTAIRTNRTQAAQRGASFSAYLIDAIATTTTRWASAGLTILTAGRAKKQNRNERWITHTADTSAAARAATSHTGWASLTYVAAVALESGPAGLRARARLTDLPHGLTSSGPVTVLPRATGKIAVAALSAIAALRGTTGTSKTGLCSALGGPGACGSVCERCVNNALVTNAVGTRFAARRGRATRHAQFDEAIRAGARCSTGAFRAPD